LQLYGGAITYHSELNFINFIERL